MNHHAPALRMVAGASILLLLLHVPSSASQAPPGLNDVLHVYIACDRTMLEPARASEDVTSCTIRDVSRDAVSIPGSGGGTGPSPHNVVIVAAARNESADAKGWQVVVTRQFMSLNGGDSATFQVKAQATPTITTQDYAFDLIATYTGPNGYNGTIVVPMGAQVQMYDFATQSIVNPVQRAGQAKVVTYTLSITNSGVYPDRYVFSAKAPPDIPVAVPPLVAVMPGETKLVNFTLLTPYGKLYEQGRSVAIVLKAQSVQGSGAYTSTASLQIRGAYVPIYWIPLALVGIASAALLGRSARDRAAMRRLEEGRPRRVQPTPRQAALMGELRLQDVAAYKARVAALDAVYRERVADYRAHRKERLEKDRAEVRAAKAEYKAAKQRRQAEEKEARRLAIIAAKERKEQERLERKELKVKKKELAKTRKKVEKARKKADRIAAKEAKAQAKRDAKQAKLDAAAAKKAEKAARRADRERKR